MEMPPYAIAVLGKEQLGHGEDTKGIIYNLV